MRLDHLLSRERASALSVHSYRLQPYGSVAQSVRAPSFAMKESHPSIRMNNHIKAHSFFVNESGVFVPPAQPQDTPVGFLQLAMEL